MFGDPRRNLTLRIIIYCNGDLYFPPLSLFQRVSSPCCPIPLPRRLAAAATAGGRVLRLHLFFLPLPAPPAAYLHSPNYRRRRSPQHRSTTPHSSPPRGPIPGVPRPGRGLAATPRPVDRAPRARVRRPAPIGDGT
jgi:hypothetical protein